MTNILVVDPNMAFSTLLTEELRREKYEVEAAFGYEEALGLGRERNFELALVDMGLAEPGGLALGQQLRVEQPELRLMFIPLMGEELAAEVGQALSIQGVLPKPFFLPELPERIEAALRAPLVVAAVVESEVEEQLESEPAAPEEVYPAVGLEAPVIEDTGPISVRVVNQHRAEIKRLMRGLVYDVGGDLALLNLGNRLMLWEGNLGADDAQQMARIVAQSWSTSSEVGRILGHEQVRFEQSLSGGDYVLYALSVAGAAILTVALRGTASLGMLRHRARSVAKEIAALCLGSAS
ncbi:MAG: response regulator [Chloroflexota bacterium]|nr:response regulator [Chloroflexota bacterium]